MKFVPDEMGKLDLLQSSMLFVPDMALGLLRRAVLFFAVRDLPHLQPAFSADRLQYQFTCNLLLSSICFFLTLLVLCFFEA